MGTVFWAGGLKFKKNKKIKKKKKTGRFAAVIK